MADDGLQRAGPPENEAPSILLSIILPVFNVEPYLEKCLNSVLACDLSGCEVLLSLGASTDESDAICARFAERFGRIRLLRQRGKGLSDARNCAMAEARGRYVVFLDSDDYVESARFDELLQALRAPGFAPDVIMTDFKRLLHPGGRFVRVYQIGEETAQARGMDFFQNVLKKRQCFWNVWRYVYRRGFLQENGLRFLENSMSEDVEFTTRVLLAQPDIAFMHCPYYVYNIGRGGSLMDRLNLARLRDTIGTIERSVERLRGSKLTCAPLAAARLQFEYLLNLAAVMELPRGERTQGKAIFSGWRETLAGSEDPLVRCAFRALGVIGVLPCAAALSVAKRGRHLLRHIREKGNERI